MAKKFNFSEARDKVMMAAEKKLEQGLEEIAEQSGVDASVHGGDGHTGDSPSVVREAAPSLPTAGTVPTVSQAAGAVRNDEPTKGVQANLPISLYNRMKRLKFETDESFQSMFQRAMDLFLDVEEGKMKVSKVQ